jgi:hypothetical protein
MSLLQLRLIVGASIILALVGGLAWFVHHERQIGAAKIRAAVEVATAQAAASAAAETARRLGAQQEVVNEAQKQAAAAKAAAGAAGRERNALRVQLAAVVRASEARRDTVPAGSCPPATDTTRVLAELLSEVDDFAGEVAAEADANRIAGSACERAYGSLR